MSDAVITSVSEGLDRFRHSDPDRSTYRSKAGLNKALIEDMSAHKNEPKWMRDFRLKSFDIFNSKPVPTWGPDLSGIDFDALTYYIRPTERIAPTWDDLPAEMKETFNKLKIPEAEQKMLAGVVAMYDSETVYKSLQRPWEEQGVIFMDMDSAVQEHPDLVREYFMTKCVPRHDNKFSALHGAVWSGGSFLYVPAGVKVQMPLQTYFRMNASGQGQFEHTLIIAEPGAEVHYIEGCHLAGSMVRVRDGEKPIEEVEEGDEVLTHHGRFRRVVEPMRRAFSGPIHHIRFQNETYRSLKVTPGHPFLIARRKSLRDHNKHFAPEWLTAQDLNVGDYLAVPTNIDLETPVTPSWGESVSIGRGSGTAVAEQVELALDTDTCRLIGLYLAEGSVTANTSYLSFDSAENEKDIQEFVASTIKRTFGLKAWEYHYKDRAGCSLRFSSVRAARFFSQAFGRTTDALHIPDWVFALGNAERAAIVQGLYDGEGSYDSQLDLYRISQTNREVAQRMRELLLSLGIRASLSRTVRLVPRRPMWQIAICKVDHPCFEELVLGREPRLGRATHAGAVIAGDYLWMPIASIEKVETDCNVFNMSVEEDESYICEGVVSHNCTAPLYSNASLHSAVVEIFVKEGARTRYTTVQNWSKNVYNLNTKRAIVEKDAHHEWVGGSLGSGVTMLYPASWLVGKGASCEHMNIALAVGKVDKDTGAKVIHGAPFTKSRVIAKSISKGGGRGAYRGLLKVIKGAHGSISNVQCDALIMDADSVSDTLPYIEVNESDVTISHEATVGRIGQEQLFYLMSRGLTEQEAINMIVSGFLEPVVKELPLEYAVELNRLIAMEMEGSVG